MQETPTPTPTQRPTDAKLDILAARRARGGARGQGDGLGLSAIGRADDDQGLDEEHDGDGQDGGDEHDLLDALLAVEEAVSLLDATDTEEQVHHGGDKVGGLLGLSGIVPVSGHLEQNEEVHVAESAEQENHLGDELEDEAEGVAEVDAVEAGEEHTENHVHDADDDRQFHLKRVVEGESVTLAGPHGVHTEGIHLVVPVVHSDGRAVALETSGLVV